jgi:ABC-type oligopeptide transport system ATPase subunit
MSELPLLRVENLTREFTSSGGLFRPRKRMRAVENVSFDLPRWSVTGVVGESGCGKSTLARLL